jgi:hypothetical protein
MAALVAPVPALAQSAALPEPVAQSPAKVKELVELMKSRELTAFAVRDPEGSGRFVAVLFIPNVQLMVVAANYQRSTDIEYRLYHKEYMTAYQDLNSGVMASNKVFLEDTMADGLVLKPAKNMAGDTIEVGEDRRVFDGEFADPRKRNDKRVPQVEYFTAFTEADARYTRLLGLILAEMKKGGSGLAEAGRLR